MEKLLKWSLAASSDPSTPPPPPELLNQFFFGAPDERTRMKELLEKAVNSTDISEREEALDDFDDLVANIDNANNMGDLWAVLLHLISDKNPAIRSRALSGVATAVQNNAQAQKILVESKHATPLLLEHINDPDPEVQSKALLAISSTVAHCGAAYDQFVEAKGWEMFTTVFDAQFDTDANPKKLRLRTLSLLHALVLNAPHKAAFSKLDSLGMVKRLQDLRPSQDRDVQERIDDILGFLRSQGYSA